MKSIYIFSEDLFLYRYSLFKIVQSITPNIIMYLPKNVDLAQLEELASLSSPPLTLEVTPLSIKTLGLGIISESKIWIRTQSDIYIKYLNGCYKR